MLLGHRVPVELRVFLTAAVIIDDIVTIGVIACSTRARSTRALPYRRGRGVRGAHGAQPLGIVLAAPERPLDVGNQKPP